MMGVARQRLLLTALLSSISLTTNDLDGFEGNLGCPLVAL